MSLLNADAKIISKALTTKLKKTLPTIISSNRTAYVNKRCISESGRLISDIIEVCEKKYWGEFCNHFSNQFGKVFDFLDHDFVATVLNKLGFGSTFISWINYCCIVSY